MTFISLYLAGQFGIFLPRGRGKSWRLLLTLMPLMLALLIAISRTCDYHHHWQGTLAIQLKKFPDLIIRASVKLIISCKILKCYYKSVM